MNEGTVENHACKSLISKHTITVDTATIIHHLVAYGPDLIFNKHMIAYILLMTMTTFVVYPA